MKTDVSLWDFQDAFKKVRPENFSYKGLEALYEYLTQYEEDCGAELELDVIAICCDFSEEPLKDVLENYDLESLEDLQNNTMVIELDDETVIYQAY